MDYEFVERQQDEVNWLLENINLADFSGRQVIPVTLGGNTREVMLHSIKQVAEYITHRTCLRPDDFDLARLVAVTIGGITIDQPEQATHQPVSIARFYLKVIGNSAEVQLLWDVGNGELDTRIHINDQFTKQDRLKLFPLLRTRLERVFDNIPGLKDYTVDFDLVNKVYQINFS